MSEEPEFRQRRPIRISLAWLLAAAIFPLAAWSQISTFHPLAPSRPPARSMRPPATPAPAQHAAGPGKSMGKLSPEMRKRVAAEMKRKAAPKGPAPQAGKRGR